MDDRPEKGITSKENPCPQCGSPDCWNEADAAVARLLSKSRKERAEKPAPMSDERVEEIRTNQSKKFHDDPCECCAFGLEEAADLLRKIDALTAQLAEVREERDTVAAGWKREAAAHDATADRLRTSVEKVQAERDAATKRAEEAERIARHRRCPERVLVCDACRVSIAGCRCGPAEVERFDSDMTGRDCDDCRRALGEEPDGE